MDRKTQCCQDISYSQCGLQTQCNSNQNHCELLCGYWQTDSEVYMVRQKIQNHQNIIEKEQ
jgi:hypothetical protein